MYIILSIISLLLFIIFVVPLFVRKDYSFSREITINKPSKYVFDYVRHLRNQEKYSKWVMTDPDMKKHLNGTDGSVGFIYGWDGNNKAGEGQQEIIGINEGEKVDIEIRFVRPFKGVAHTPISTTPVSESQTKVTWGMQGTQKYPMNLMNLFNESLLGKDLEASLSNLKNILETN
jgi:hypothetical protein